MYQRGYHYFPRLRTQPQFGRGFGSAIASLARYFRPLLIRGLKTVGKEVLDAGSDILANIQGQPMQQLVKARSETALENLKRKARDQLEPLMKGESAKRRCCTKRAAKKNTQRGRGIKRVVKGRTSSQSKKTTKRPTTVRRQRVKDIFG